MVYAILLDVDQTTLDQYGVSYSGTLDYCDEQTDIPVSTESWAKSDYGDPTTIKPKSLGGQPGKIVEMSLKSNFMAFTRIAKSTSEPSSTLPSSMAGLLAAFAGGTLLGFLIGHSMAGKDGK